MLLERRIKDKDALKIVFNIIDSEDKRLNIGAINFIFLGRKSNGNYAKFKDVRRKIRKKFIYIK